MAPDRGVPRALPSPVAPVGAAGSSAAPRRQDIELLRIVGAFGIVWFHTQPYGAAVAYGGLIAFLVLSILLGGKSGPVTAQTLGRRARRLLVPWMVWFAIYGALNRTQGLDFIALDRGLVSAVMAGTSIHLWYLPFIFLCLTGLDVLKAHLPRPVLAYAAAAAAIAITAAAPVWRPVTLALPYPCLQWADALAPVLAGVFLLCADALPVWHRRAMALVLFGCAVAVSVSESIGTSYAIGYGACLVIASGLLKSHIRVNLLPLSEATFGIYLLHILVWTMLLTHADVPRDFMPFAIFSIAASVVIALRRLMPRIASVWS